MSSPDKNEHVDQNDAIGMKEKVDDSSDGSNKDPSEALGSHRGYQFYLVFIALSVTGLLSSVEATIISTALPTIVEKLDMGSTYAWVANAYFLTRSVRNAPLLLN